MKTDINQIIFIGQNWVEPSTYETISLPFDSSDIRRASFGLSVTPITVDGSGQFQVYLEGSNDLPSPSSFLPISSASAYSGPDEMQLTRFFFFLDIYPHNSPVIPICYKWIRVRANVGFNNQTGQRMPPSNLIITMQGQMT